MAFECAPVGALVARVHADGTSEVLQANPALARLLGEPLGLILGSDLSRFLLPEDTAEAARDRLAVATGGPGGAQKVRRFRSGDGSLRWADVRVVPVTLPQEPGPLVLAYFADVTDRHEDEVRRSQVAAMHEFLARVVTDVLGGQELADTYRQVVEGVAGLFGAVDVAVALTDPASGEPVVVAAVGPVGTALLGGDLSWGRDAMHWRLAQPVAGMVVPDASSGIPAQDRTSFGPAISSVFATGRAGVRGLLSAARIPGGEPFSEDDASLLTALAQQVALAIELGRGQSEQRRQAAVRDAYLARLEGAIRPLSDPAEIRQAACRALVEQVDVERAVYVDIEDERIVVLHGGPRVGAAPRRLGVMGPIAVGVLRRGEALVVHDAARDPRFDEGERADRIRAGYPASITVPLVKDGRLTAALGVPSGTPRSWSDLEVRLVQDTAERTWAALERSQAERASAEERALRLRAERDLLERQARERREQLEREFITNAAHELRTPLTGILGAVDTLEAGAADDPVQRRRFLGHLRREATRLNLLSDALLQLAQAQSAGDLPHAPFVVRPLLESVAGGLHACETVAVSVESDADLVVVSHRGLLEVLVGNLAANAVRYTREGQVVLAAARCDGGVVIEVWDTGPGMDEATLQRARDRFFRRRPTVSDGSGAPPDREGFGLGLSIAAQAAAALGAVLQLESAPQVGTCARVAVGPPAAGSRRPAGPS